MKFSRFIFLYFIAFSLSPVFAQQREFPQDYFRPPLNIAPQASGSFGELRSNHFHGGTDYRTQQREGLPVYAVADGFISRARVQIGGGGHALYVAHPNGYTSVYMHLQRFNDLIAPVVKRKQYELESFSVDFAPDERIHVKKGDVIAFSGNTGGSSGPHLHFELRDSKTEEVFNPQLFGLTIPDNRPPDISGFMVFRLGDAPFSENTPREQRQVVGSNGNYRLSPNTVIPVNGNTGFGIVSTDQNSASANRNGIYSMELLLDGEPIFSSSFTGFFFQHSRALNSYIDYPTYVMKGRRFQKSFVEPGNPLTIYHKLVNNGLIDIQDDKEHDLLYRVRDIAGNTSTLAFKVRYSPDMAVDQHLKRGTTLLPYNQPSKFEQEGIRIEIPAHTLYSPLHFEYSASAKKTGGYSPVHHVHNRMIPLHGSYTLSIRADESLPPNLRDKALLVDARGRSHGGSFDNGYVTTKAREFGSFHITTDTKPPVIRPLNMAENKTAGSRASFKISDDLSGIHSFNGYIDGNWVLMEYDAKTASLWHTFEPNLAKGKHEFRLVVSDGKGNESVYRVNFLK
jgi:hypothetical protein